MTELSSTPSRRGPAGARSLWRNPRFVVGLLLVLGSVVLGAQLFAAADDSVEVWTVRVDVAAGQQITDAMVAPRRVRFADAEEANRYLSASSELPLPALATRPIGAGELLPRGALGVAERLQELPLAVDGAYLPSTVRTGSLVDVWSVPPKGEAVRVLAAVPVLAVDPGPDRGAGTATQVVVGLTAAQVEGLPRLLPRLVGSELVLVRSPVS